MSRFVNTTVTRTVDLGPCECPGTPHERDEAEVRAELSNQEIVDFANSADGAETAARVAEFTVSWNLLGLDGKPWPPTEESILALFTPTIQKLIQALSLAVNESATRGTSPNASSAPSGNGSRASGSSTRKTLKAV